MGQGNQPALRVTFDSRLKPKFQGSTSDAGLLGYREFDEALGLTGLGGRAAQDLKKRLQLLQCAGSFRRLCK
jgi:hypothetical protein